MYIPTPAKRHKRPYVWGTTCNVRIGIAKAPATALVLSSSIHNRLRQWIRRSISETPRMGRIGAPTEGRRFIHPCRPTRSVRLSSRKPGPLTYRPGLVPLKAHSRTPNSIPLRRQTATSAEQPWICSLDPCQIARENARNGDPTERKVPQETQGSIT